MEVKPNNPHPPRHKPYREPDAVANHLRDDVSTYLLTADGRHVRAELVGEGRYHYLLEDKAILPKTACVGAFSPDIDALVVSKEHPVREVSVSRAQRFNAEKMQVLYPEYRVGLSLRVILMNGWELVGKIEHAGQLYVALRLSESQTVSLYRHAIADYAWEGGEPPAVSPEQAQKTLQRRKELFIHPKQARKLISQAAPVPPPKREVKPLPTPASWYGLLSELWREGSEVERAIMNAKLKLVFRGVPAELREVGDAVWIPIQNQPKDVPGGFNLASMSMELVVPKKMWKNALKKAEEQKQQTGNDAIYVMEALIGTHQDRFCAVASGIQIAEAKPRTIEPKSPEAKRTEPIQPPKSAPEAKPTAPIQEAKPTGKKPIVPVVEVIKRPEPKPTPEEKPEAAQAKEEKPQEASPKEPEPVAEAKPAKKRVFDLTVDGIETEPLTEAKPTASDAKAKLPKTKFKPAEVANVKPKK